MRRLRFFKASTTVLTALAFNNWALGPWLNPVLFKDNGSISEFSVGSQPHHWVFRSLDIISGALLVGLAMMLMDELGRSRLGKFILIFTAILGIGNITDAIFTLRCSETLSAACSIPVKISFSHYQVPAHAYSSVLIALCYFLLPLTGLIYSLRLKNRFLIAVSSLAVASALYSFGSALSNYIRDRALSVRASGTSQGIEIIILTLWIVVFYVYLLYGSSRLKLSKVEHEP